MLDLVAASYQCAVRHAPVALTHAGTHGATYRATVNSSLPTACQQNLRRDSAARRCYRPASKIPFCGPKCRPTCKQIYVANQCGSTLRRRLRNCMTPSAVLRQNQRTNSQTTVTTELMTITILQHHNDCIISATLLST